MFNQIGRAVRDILSGERFEATYGAIRGNPTSVASEPGDKPLKPETPTVIWPLIVAIVAGGLILKLG